MGAWGIYSRVEMRNQGWNRYRIDQALASKRFRDLGRFGIATADTPPELIMAAEWSGRLTCVSAAKLYGLWTLDDPFAHLWYGHSAHRDYGHFLVQERHSKRLKETLPAAPITSLLDSVVHALKCLPTRDALVIAESAVIKGHVQLATLDSCLKSPREAGARKVVGLIDPRSQSALETVARLLLVEAGYRVEPQFAIKGLGHVDLLVEGRLVVELDGYDFHRDKKNFAEDRRRNNVAAMQGFPTLRFTASDIFSNPGLVLNQVRAALAHRS